MRRRLLTAMLLVAVLAVTGFGIPLAFAVQAFYRDEALLLLFGEASRGAVAVPGSFEVDDDTPELPRAVDGVQLGLYTRDGLLLTGDGPAAADEPVVAVLTGAADQRDREQLVVVVPVSQDEDVVGAVRASLPQRYVATQTYRAWAAMTGLAALVVVACAGLATASSRRLAAPLSRLASDAELIGSGGEVGPAPRSGVPEVDAVTAALTSASTRLNLGLARERSFSADVAHQLRNPLSALRIRLESEQMHPDQVHGDLIDGCLEDVARLQQTIDDLVELAREDRPRRARIHLSPLLRDVDRRWRPRASAVHRDLTLSMGTLPAIAVSPAAVRQILDVLVDNALTHGEGDIRISAEPVGRGLVLTVQDRGTRAIDADTVFTRRHPSAGGSGIGLALARRLAEAEGMDLSVSNDDSSPGFRLSIGGDLTV